MDLEKTSIDFGTSHRDSLALSRKSFGSDKSGRFSIKEKQRESTTTAEIQSIADIAYARYKRACYKLYTNRVYVPWYRRYASILPVGQRFESQPYAEVQRRDEDIALQYFYGDEELLWDIPNNKLAIDRRRQALRRYKKLKDKEEEQKLAERSQPVRVVEEKFHVPSLRSIIEANKSKLPDMKDEFGPTVKEIRKINPVVDYLTKLHVKKRRANVRKSILLQVRSKWHILGQPLARAKMKRMFAESVRERIRQRFRRVIQLVCCVNRFINTISIMSGDTRRIFRSVKAFQAEQMRKTELSKNQKRVQKIIFDPTKYKIAKEIHFPMVLNMILTKPWFERTEKEVALVTQNLQRLRSFVEYPPTFQLKLARVAWLIEVPKHKVIIRQRHIAQDFYFMLTGKAKMSRLEGDPYFKENQDMKKIGMIKKDCCFGDECLAHPESERSYSVISMDECTMLAINVHDYSKMLMKKRDDETAPEHLRFLTGLKFLKDFPKLKLLQEGIEYISMYYYRPNSLIAKSMKECKYVYVVWSGTARVLVEIPPPPEVVAEYEARKELPLSRRRSSPPPELKTATLSEMMLEFMEQPHGPEQRKSVFKSAADTLFLDSKLQAQLKDVEQKYTEVFKKQTDAIKAEVTEIRGKAQKMLKTLPKHLQTRLTEATIEEDDQFYDLPLVIEELAPRRSASPRASWSSAQGFRLAPSVTGTASVASARSVNFKIGKDEAPRLSRRASQIVGSNMGFCDTVSKILQKVGFPGSSVCESVQPEPDDLDSPRLSRVFGSETVLTESSENIQPPTESSKTKQTTVSKQKYSVWKEMKYLVKGDFIGIEWLDYNDGPFEPPEEQMSLVSDGCELIMIKKCFLMKYLRKEW